MRPHASFADLMMSLRHGDEEAAEVVFRRFAHRLIALADQHLLTLVRPKVDAEDVVQSAFRSFFRRQRKEQFDLDDWNNLWSLLALITVRKCAKKNARFHKPGRDVRKEQATLSGEDEGDALWEVIAREPAPEDAVMLAETVEQILDGLRPHEREMVLRRLQGDSVHEISTALDCTERKAQRVLERVRKRLQHLRTLEIGVS
jgi:RNA polymerase sigma-70 factor (ECF subfamily)